MIGIDKKAGIVIDPKKYSYNVSETQANAECEIS
jgi:hypothetical protein